MMQAHGINPEFYTLLTRSEELLAMAKVKRASEPYNWREIDQLHTEIDQMSDEMTSMIYVSGMLKAA